MVHFNQKDKDLAQGIYADMAEAVARAVARREATVAAVHVAVFQHRYGTDVSAHASQEAAEAALVAIASRECARDPELRQRVIDRFGAWPAQEMDDGSLSDLVELWTSLSGGESMWTVECDVELGDGRERRHADDGDEASSRWEA